MIPDPFQVDEIIVTLEDVQTTILRVFQFFATNPKEQHIGLNELVEGLARLGEPVLVTDSIQQLLTPIFNTFPRLFILQYVN